MMNFPPPATRSVDWKNVGTGITEVNGHIECHYSVKIGKWSSPSFVEDPFLRIHGLASGLNYGQQSYEGMKAYRSHTGDINIFRVRKHATRMAASASFISVPPIPIELFALCVHLAVSRNAEFVPPHDTDTALYIRPLVFGSSAQLGLVPPKEYTFSVYVLPINAYHGNHPADALILDDFDRAAPKGVGSAKVGGNYAPVIKWSDAARELGYGITLHLDSKTGNEIEEFSTSGFIGIIQAGDEVTMVIPDSKNVIQSITSDSCVEIARSWGWNVQIRAIPYTELPNFTEVVAVGTAAALVSIRSITRELSDDKFFYRDGANEAGPCCVKLTKALQDIQRGRARDTFGWLDQVGHYGSYVMSAPE